MYVYNKKSPDISNTEMLRPISLVHAGIGSEVRLHWLCADVHIAGAHCRIPACCTLILLRALTNNTVLLCSLSSSLDESFVMGTAA